MVRGGAGKGARRLTVMVVAVIVVGAVVLVLEESGRLTLQISWTRVLVITDGLL